MEQTVFIRDAFGHVIRRALLEPARPNGQGDIGRSGAAIDANTFDHDAKAIPGMIMLGADEPGGHPDERAKFALGRIARTRSA